jgi:hypothetical protein
MGPSLYVHPLTHLRHCCLGKVYFIIHHPLPPPQAAENVTVGCFALPFHLQTSHRILKTYLESPWRGGSNHIFKKFHEWTKWRRNTSRTPIQVVWRPDTVRYHWGSELVRTATHKQSDEELIDSSPALWFLYWGNVWSNNKTKQKLHT